MKWLNLGRSTLINRFKYLDVVLVMNSTPNKASLWKSCVEQGIFDKVPPDSMYQVQGLFERTIQQFKQEDMDLAMANQLLLKEFRFQLGKLTGQPVQQKTFEELNEEYREQYQPKPPSQIEFSREKDSPIQDLEAILQQKSEQRQNEIQDFFKDPKERLIEIPEMSIKMTNEMPEIVKEIQKDIRKESELDLHRRILESILESQLKIIELLQRK